MTKADGWHRQARSLTLAGRICGLLVVMICVTGRAVAGDDPPSTAEQILDKYVEATGGKAAYEKLHDRVMNGTFEIPAMGIKGPMSIYHAEPAKMYTVVEAEGIGKLEDGTNGEVAWELSAMSGPRIKQGAERAVVLRSAQFDAAVNWRKLYKKVELVGEEPIDEQPCYKVVLTPAEGRPETQYYDKKSNLLVRSDMVLEHAMGSIPLQVYMSDYKVVDGVRIPHTIRQLVAGQEYRITVDKIRHNVPVPDKHFKLPAEVEALTVQKEKKAESRPAPAPAQ